MKWLVKQEWHYTVEVEVEADTKREAIDMADEMEGERIHNDKLVDATAKQIAA